MEHLRHHFKMQRLAERSTTKLLLAGITSMVMLQSAPVSAQSSTDIASLREELASLKQEQDAASARIARIEAALSEVEGNSVLEPIGSISTPDQPQAMVAANRASKSTSTSSRLNLSGDVRVRYEANQGEQNVRNRHRGVVRARLRGNYTINDILEAGAQLSTGDNDDPNTADVSLDSFDDDLTVSLDQVYLKAKFGNLTLVGGKVPQPFKRTDLVWDGDVSPQGLSGSYQVQLSPSTSIKANALYFLIDEATTAADTSMVGGQVELTSKTDNFGFGVAVGYYDYRLRTLDGADAGDFRSNLRLLDGSYLSDFNLLDVIGTVTFPGFDDAWPVTITGDYVHNFGAAVDADTGLSGEVAFGRASQPGDWKVGYGYAQAEVDAVFAAFSHDNLAIATNYRLHSIAVDYVPVKHTSLNLTWYHYRPLEELYSGSGNQNDWLDRIRLNLMVDF